MKIRTATVRETTSKVIMGMPTIVYSDCLHVTHKGLIVSIEGQQLGGILVRYKKYHHSRVKKIGQYGQRNSRKLPEGMVGMRTIRWTTCCQ
ncbi:hypothetical protein DPMN_143857 [Dreissena polymorpha]|uniref:Uncharacterized protein n=1 Tax=Dreissena polymorpha TaxID=45954 RepID=A0A9D4GDW7_DREPO|nr:hypothetical protein DPMN_143857 [Dreissena polymorpha]